jgi:hypothetical protein
MKIEVDTPTEYKVENKPVQNFNSRDKMQKYPFDKMKVGQSFFIPEPNFQQVNRVRSAATHYGKRHDVTFAIVRDGNGYRCGRIA